MARAEHVPTDTKTVLTAQLADLKAHQCDDAFEMARKSDMPINSGNATVTGDGICADWSKAHFSGHRPIEERRCHHLVVTKRDNDSDRLPGPLPHIINHPRATWSADLEPRHVGADCR